MGERLRLTDSARLGALGDFRLEQENVRNLQSELTTTRKGYEAQLNTMTEELAQERVVHLTISNILYSDFLKFS